jgi:hypothetical protein
MLSHTPSLTQNPPVRRSHASLGPLIAPPVLLRFTAEYLAGRQGGGQAAHVGDAVTSVVNEGLRSSTSPTYGARGGHVSSARLPIWSEVCIADSHIARSLSLPLSSRACIVLAGDYLAQQGAAAAAAAPVAPEPPAAASTGPAYGTCHTRRAPPTAPFPCARG